MQGELVSVENRPLGSELVAAAAAGDTALLLDLAADFPTAVAGFLSLNGATLAFTSVDPDTEVVTLAAPLAAAAAVSDFAQLVDNGVPAERWTANVSIDDGDPIEAVIPTGLIPYFPVGSYDDPLAVSIEWDPKEEEYRVTSQPDRAPSFDGISIWNPHVLLWAAAATIPSQTGSAWTSIAQWTVREVDGMTVGSDVMGLYSGIYTAIVQIGFAYSPDGRRRLRVIRNGDSTDLLYLNTSTPDPVASFSSFVGGSFLAPVELNDLITVQVQQTSGSDLDLSVGPGRSFFSMIRSSI